MEKLPRGFLTEIASQYDLSEEQREAFIELFSSQKSQKEIADSLHISDNAFRTRMTGVYQKFSLGGKEPNKQRKLYDFLLTKYKIYANKTEVNPIESNPNIDELVQEVRKKIKSDIQQRCGKMQVLDMTQPIGLGDIYTDVNILDKMTSLRRFTLEELHHICHSDGNIFDRLGWVKGEKRINGLDAVKCYNKLMVWGKPGAGKTTFLKYISIACIKNQFSPEKIPIFVTLKQFAETEIERESKGSLHPTLLNYIINQFRKVNVKENEIQTLLAEGKCLILLDGLDEVKPEHSDRIINQIQKFADRNN
ncbi:NACHT domain-containing protein, partial [Rippkaea orientalis]|uniref:sigma-70 region 4 domain-containing protein n=1 Tax=Rippkaea orientalis TaxID=2546366 RepID=UPI00017254BD